MACSCNDPAKIAARAERKKLQAEKREQMRAQIQANAQKKATASK